LWFDRSDHDLGEYAKVHLVPLSEYVPFRKSWPWLHQTLRSFVPPSMTQLEPGTEYRTFKLHRGDKTWTVVAPICYEGTFDRLCRKMVVQDGKKVANIIANISNDGWFTWKWFEGRGSNENAEHLSQYYFRAVENRVPVVRAVNTGISASIDSNGRLLAEISQHGKREMVAGTLLLKDNAKAPADVQIGPQVLVDSRVSLYSLVGDVFPALVCAVAIGSFAWITMKRRKQTQGASK
jgi:apolipoprotein N-acyltransferase